MEDSEDSEEAEESEDMEAIDNSEPVVVKGASACETAHPAKRIQSRPLVIGLHNKVEDYRIF